MAKRRRTRDLVNALITVRAPIRPTARLMVGDVDSGDLKYFMALAHVGNFRRAAAQLGISQPVLTRRVTRLEREFGTYLVERHPDSIRLTHAGKVLAERASRVAVELDRLKRDMAAAADGWHGQLAVGFYTSLGSDILHRVLTVFAARQDLDLDLYEGTRRQQLEALHQHRIDLALVVGPIADDAVNAESLWAESLAAVVPADHPLSGRDTVSWADLAGHRILARAVDHDHSGREFILARGAAAGVSLRIKEYHTSRESLATLIRAGFGLGITPETGVRNVNMAGLASPRLTGVATAIEIFGVWLPENANPAVRRFLEQVTLAAREGQRPVPPAPTPSDEPSGSRGHTG